MRKVFGARSILSLFIAGAVGVWAACGGSEVQDVVETDAGSDTGAPEPKDSGGTPPEPKKPDAAADSGVDAGGGGKEYDAGKPISLDGGPLCVEGGEVEEEPNDTTAEANELRPTRCGIVEVTDGGADGGESDFLTFQLGDASTEFFLQYAGDVSVVVETDGQAPVDITATPPPTLPFVKGQPYFVEVRSATGKSQPWRVTLFEEEKK